MEEAAAIWRQIPPERINGIPAIGIHVHRPGEESYMDDEIDFAEETSEISEEAANTAEDSVDATEDVEISDSDMDLIHSILGTDTTDAEE